MLYDIVIIGSGVAGLSAGIYAGRANKSVLIIEDNNIGGTTVTLPNINNYPGFTNISGVELVSNMYKQCLNFDVKFDFLRIDSIDFDRNIIRTDNNIIEYKTLIIASGSTYKRLNIDTEEKFKLHGLSYCAVCDGNLYKEAAIQRKYTNYGYGNFADMVEGLVAQKKYGTYLLSEYTMSEVEELGNYINPDRDLLFNYEYAIHHYKLNAVKPVSAI